MILLATAMILIVSAMIRFRLERIRLRRELLRLDDNVSTFRQMVEQLQASNDRFAKVRCRSQLAPNIDSVPVDTR